MVQNYEHGGCMTKLDASVRTKLLARSRRSAFTITMDVAACYELRLVPQRENEWQSLIRTTTMGAAS
jgi:hypothetical protein